MLNLTWVPQGRQRRSNDPWLNPDRFTSSFVVRFLNGGSALGFRRLFMRRRASASDDPHDILRQGAGPASRRVRSLLSAGKRPSNALVDRAATEKEAQARQFFEAVGAVPVGRAIYSGILLWTDPSIGATPVVVFATAPRAFRDTRYWL